MKQRSLRAACALSILVATAGCHAIGLASAEPDPGRRRPPPPIASTGQPAGGGAGDVARTCARLGEPRSELAPDVRVALARMLGCASGAGWPDRGLPEEPSSAVAAVGWVGGCLAVSLDRLPDLDHRLPSYAVCGAEARAIDRAAFAADLAGLNLSDGARARAEAYFDQLAATTDALDAHLASKIGDDPALRELFYGAPEAALADARANLTRGAAQREAVAAFAAAAARGRAAVSGCATSLRDALVGRLRQARVATVDRALLGSRDAIGQPVLRALAACARMENLPAVAAAVDEILAGSSDYAGARTLAYWYVHDEVRKLRADRGDFWFDVGALPRPPITPYPFVDTDLYDDYLLRAPIRSLTPAGDDVLVFFDGVRVRQRRRECRATDRVSAVESDGTVRYYKACTDLGTVNEDATEAPVVVAASHAGALRKGRTAEMHCERRGERRRCFPVFVWQDKERKRVVGYLGAAL